MSKARQSCSGRYGVTFDGIPRGPMTTTEMLNEMKSGDIMTHCYHRGPSSILDEDGKIRPEFRKAVQRGVLFASLMLCDASRSLPLNPSLRSRVNYVKGSGQEFTS